MSYRISNPGAADAAIVRSAAGLTPQWRLVLVAALVSALFSCMDPIQPAAPLPECSEPALDTADWVRVGPDVSSFLLPPGFEPVAGGWQRGQTRVGIRYRSDAAPSEGTPEDRTITGGCTAHIAGRPAVVEFGTVEQHSAQFENHVVGTWPNIRSGCATGRVLFESMTYDAAERPMLMKMIFSVQIVEETGPGSCF
jgi:hypothetical protein